MYFVSDLISTVRDNKSLVTASNKIPTIMFISANAPWAKIVQSGFTKIFDESQIFDNSNEIQKLNTLITFQPKVSDKK